MELYDRLGVPPNATAKDIGRAYRRLAVSLHPDKHDNDEEMAQKFREVTEAYEVLSSPEKRASYHYHGQQGLEMAVVSEQRQAAQTSTSLEQRLERHFGDGRFKHLIGDLPVHYLVTPGINGVTFETFDHDGRIAQLAEALADRLQLFVAGQFGEFERSVFEEAQALREESMGPQLLATLGYVYERCGYRGLSHLQLGRSRGGANERMAHLRCKAHVLGNYMSAFGSGMRLLVRLRRQNPNYADPTVMPALLDALWRMNRVEIEKTVTAACKRVLREPSQTLAVLELRARGLITLGQIFSSVARMPVHHYSDTDTQEGVDGWVCLWADILAYTFDWPVTACIAHPARRIPDLCGCLYASS